MTNTTPKSNFYASKVTMTDVYIENWVPGGGNNALTWSISNGDFNVLTPNLSTAGETVIDGLTFASGENSYFDLLIDSGDLTLRNVTWNSPGAFQVRPGGSLTEEISFTGPMSTEVRFSGVAENNIVDEKFTGKLTVGHGVGSFTVWNPENAADINAVEIIVPKPSTGISSPVILYTDTLDQYKGTFTAIDMTYLELRHDEGVDRFATHKFSADTTISGGPVSPGYSMAEKAYGWGTDSNLLELQVGKKFDIMVIGSGEALSQEEVFLI